jgi:hypothetical protein
MPLVYGAAAVIIWESIAKFNAIAFGLVLAIMATAAFRGLGTGANPEANPGWECLIRSSSDEESRAGREGVSRGVFHDRGAPAELSGVFDRACGLGFG